MGHPNRKPKSSIIKASSTTNSRLYKKCGRQDEFIPQSVTDGMFIYRLQTESGSYYGKVVMVR